MVTGARAFGGTSTPDTLSAVIRAQPKPPSAVIAAIPSDLEKVILRCLRKDPQRRFQHMDDVKIALQDIKEESGSGVGSPAPIARTRRIGRIVTLGAIVILVFAATTWVLRSHRPAEGPPPRVVPLTTLRGREFYPTFSPDGEQVAFAWDAAQDNWDIYVTLVGSSNVRRLTTDPARDAVPKWSPDGRQIAFLRERPDGNTIQVVSALGGEDRKLSDFVGANSIGWSPDGHWLVAGRSGENGSASQPRGIYLIPVDGGEARSLIASSPVTTDSQPAFSPDGRRLAYVSCSRLGEYTSPCDVYLVELNAAHTPLMPPRRLTTHRSVFRDSLAWARDGSAVIYAAAPPTSPRPDLALWRVAVAGTELARAHRARRNGGACARRGAIPRPARVRTGFVRR